MSDDIEKENDETEETYAGPPTYGFAWPSAKNLVSREELRSRLEAYSRQPFLDALSALLEVRPDPVSLAMWARAHPDRWANAISVMAKLGGYADQKDVNVNLFTDIQRMG